MNIKIRYTVESDISTLAQVHSRSLQAAFGELFPIEIVNERFSYERRFSGFTKEIEKGEPFNALVYVDENPVGVVSFGPSRHIEIAEDTIELWRMYILPEFWGTGAASEAMNWAFSEIKKIGYKRTILWVLEENTRAQRFYEKCGFIKTEQILDAEFGRPIRDFMYEIDLEDHEC